MNPKLKLLMFLSGVVLLVFSLMMFADIAKGATHVVEPATPALVEQEIEVIEDRVTIAMLKAVVGYCAVYGRFDVDIDLDGKFDYQIQCSVHPPVEDTLEDH